MDWVALMPLVAYGCFNGDSVPFPIWETHCSQEACGLALLALFCSWYRYVPCGPRRRYYLYLVVSLILVYTMFRDWAARRNAYRRRWGRRDEETTTIRQGAMAWMSLSRAKTTHTNCHTMGNRPVWGG